VTPATPALGGARRSGVLLHPTSLPGRFGIGTIGPEAHLFTQWLRRAGQSLWQILPLTPVDYLGCPYASPSAFASNPLLISLPTLIDDGWLDSDDVALRELAGPGPRGVSRVDYDHQLLHRLPAVRRAAARVVERGADGLDAFVASESFWLDPWAEWAARRDPSTTPDLERAIQFLFDQQWQRLRAACRQAGIALVGDLPIFVSGDSADVDTWPELFKLGDEGKPGVVAGVPPDAFSETGQLWGNPLYDWEAHAAQDWQWWKQRVRTLLRLVDYVRVDHFRGFAACWEVPADAPDARQGRWVEGPGRALFDALAEDLGGLPFLAEDLGIITPDVEELRDGLGLPGMRVLQFAFDGDPDHAYLPHNYPGNCVAYTGTHDNDTSMGWYASTNDSCRDVYRRYAARSGSDPAGDLIRLASSSSADTCILPMQDVLRLGGDTRMNVPGTVGEHNWTWRLAPEQLHPGAAGALRETTRLYGRLPRSQEER
jgi:4-alpha-glucanotransferase